MLNELCRVYFSAGALNAFSDIIEYWTSSSVASSGRASSSRRTSSFAVGIVIAFVQFTGGVAWRTPFRSTDYSREVVGVQAGPPPDYARLRCGGNGAPFPVVRATLTSRMGCRLAASFRLLSRKGLLLLLCSRPDRASSTPSGLGPRCHPEDFDAWA